MENPERNERKYSLLASFLDKLTDMQAGELEFPEDETCKKLLFVWDECNPPETDTGKVWEKVSQKIRDNGRTDMPAIHRPAGKRIHIRRIFAGVAAATALLIGIAGLLLWQGRTAEVQPISQLMLADVSPEDIQEVTLVVSENERIAIDEYSKIVYSPAGQISICSKTAKEDKSDSQVVDNVASKDMYNQIIVPRGKRIELVLSDNSRMWVNAGSTVLYPRTFDAEKREIYVEGEVYLEVTPDSHHPFTVHTERLSVEVLGTAFDVRAYKGYNDAVVLVSGKVKVKGTTMSPNERIEIDSEGIAKLQRVNVHDYIYWVNNVWKLDGQPLKQVLDMLSDYFGEKISCTPDIAGEPVYGKLYLHNDVNQLIKVITQTLQETINLKNDSIYMESSENKRGEY